MKTIQPKTITYQDAFQCSLKYFDGDELAANVWLSKYALRDDEGQLTERSPDDMHWRMAKEMSRIENKFDNPLSEDEIYDLLRDFKYLVPQGGSMSGIGNNNQYVSLSNCFVIGNETNADSYGAVMKMDEEQIQLMKRRGGVGHDLSTIRPKGSRVLNSAQSATGVAPFMERYSNSTREVAQEGRRGALMLSIDIKHPDSEAFIDAKLDQQKVTGANISVRIDDQFMKAVEKGKTYTLKYPTTGKPTITKNIEAQDLWKKIVHNAWKSAEPGILFWDTITRESVADCYQEYGFKTSSTNPCGEIPLCPYDSCRLLAINLYSYVNNPFTSNASFDNELFKKHAQLAVRLMDDIVELELEKINSILEKIERDPESEDVKYREKNLWTKIKEKCQQGRRIGIGITAEADMLAALGITYGNDKATTFCENLHQSLAISSYMGSSLLAKERGAFPIFDLEKEVKNPFLKRLYKQSEVLEKSIAQYGRRHIALLTIAPTGTTSLMTQTSSGLEPVFQIAYKRRKKITSDIEKKQVDFIDNLGDHWIEFYVLHPKFKTWLTAKGYSNDQIQALKEEQISSLVQQSPYVGATANEIDYVKKVALQGKIQQWVDHSISVTVNLPKDVSENTVDQIYRQAWRLGCKGITVYRDGSRDGVLVSTESKTEQKTKQLKRPAKLEAKIIRFINEDQKWMAVIGLMNGKPYEIFTGRTDGSFHLPQHVNEGWVIKSRAINGQKRYDFQYQDEDGYCVTIEGLSRMFHKEYWNYAKLISGVLRHGMPLNAVVHLVNNLHLNNDNLLSWKKGIVRALSQFIENGTHSLEGNCPSCEEDALAYEEGCLHCKNCGFSKCS